MSKNKYPQPVDQTPVQVPEVDTAVKYRYACPMCTNVAFKSPTVDVGSTDKVCASCNQPLPNLVAENYIAL